MDREEQIGAYVAGDMSPEDAKAFEQCIAADESLRREIEEWRAAFEATREWIDSDAPGIERANEIRVPSLVGPERHVPADSRRYGHAPQPARVITLRRAWLYRTAAAAAIFIMGFVLGQFTRSESPVTPMNQNPPIPAGLTKQTSEPTPSEPIPPAPEPTPAPAEAPTAPAVAKAPAPRYTTDEQGRLIVETTLKETGAQAFWVVDANLQLAQSAKLSVGGQP